MSIVLLPKNLAALAELAGEHNGRYALNAMRVSVSANETGIEYDVTATDGCCLARVRGPQDDPGEFPKVKGLKQTKGVVEALLPAADLTQALNGVPKKPAKPILRNLACNLGKDSTTLISTNLETERVAQVRNLEGGFPPVEKVFPSEKPFFTIHVDPARLRTLADVAARFSRDITLEFHGHDKAIVFRGKNDLQQEFLGLFMPLSATDEDRLALDVRDRLLSRAAQASVKEIQRTRKRQK